MKLFVLSLAVSLLLMTATLGIADGHPDLVAYFPFDGNPEDASGNDNHGKITGRYKLVEGKFGDTIHLDPGAYVEMQTSDSLNGDIFKSDPFAISAWIQPNFKGDYWQQIWRSIGTGQNTFFLNIDGVLSWRGRTRGYWTVLCETDWGIVEADKWTHVLIQSDGDKFRIYADGEKVAETDFQETLGNNITYRIGDSGDETFAGLIDDVAVFTRALHEEEISLILNGAAIFLSGVRLSPTTVYSPAVGEQFTLSVKIVDGENVAGYQATLQFDTSALRYVESSNGNYFPAVASIVQGNTVTLISGSLTEENKGDGVLAIITFEVIAVKPSTLKLSEVSFVDLDGRRSAPRFIKNAAVEIAPEDINEDGIFNILDLVLVGANFGQTGENSADVNEDGIVDIVDLILVASAIASNTAGAPSLWDHNLEVAPTRAEVQHWLMQAQRLNLTDPTAQRGIVFLEQLLATLTPKETALLPNYPNPFNPETWIPYQLAEPANMTVSIYSVNGRLIRTLELGHQSIGIYESRSRAAYWNGRNAQGEPVASGVYFYTLTAGDFSATKKMVIRR